MVVCWPFIGGHAVGSLLIGGPLIGWMPSWLDAFYPVWWSVGSDWWLAGSVDSDWWAAGSAGLCGAGLSNWGPAVSSGGLPALIWWLLGLCSYLLACCTTLLIFAILFADVDSPRWRRLLTAWAVSSVLSDGTLKDRCFAHSDWCPASTVIRPQLYSFWLIPSPIIHSKLCSFWLVLC